MPRACATPRASAMACGPQHLSSAREIQSCGQTFIVTPTTSYPCCLSRYAATLESTPPLIPITTRGRVEEAGFEAGEDSVIWRADKVPLEGIVSRGIVVWLRLPPHTPLFLPRSFTLYTKE